ncbi:MAG: hypothetical protein QHH06_06635 [Clostridiales bacterium]|jgi:hypothetical protein|nr:hypothetical protein [Eubacteriales bacterium]MDH7566141.1 hypothetical protein [Clostridiales bacterium]
MRETERGKLGSEKGSAAHDIVMFAAVIVFVLLPVFSVVFEKYALLCKGQIIKDAVDMTNVSTYMAINSRNLGKNSISFDSPEVAAIYRDLLARNLNLNRDLTPRENSVAENTVTIDSLVCYTAGFPLACPEGKKLARPAVHSCVTVPVRPVLLRQMILELMGKQYIELKVHVDSDIPVNN